MKKKKNPSSTIASDLVVLHYSHYNKLTGTFLYGCYYKQFRTCIHNDDNNNYHFIIMLLLLLFSLEIKYLIKVMYPETK